MIESSSGFRNFFRNFFKIVIKKKNYTKFNKKRTWLYWYQKKTKKKKIKIYEVLQFFLQTQLKSKNELTKDKIRTANVEMKVKKWVMMIDKREIYIYIYMYTVTEGDLD